MLYICHFCDYTTNAKNKYYTHIHTHIIKYRDDLSPDEIELSEYYHKKMHESVKNYRKTNKDKIRLKLQELGI